MLQPIDPTSLAGKQFAIAEHTPLLVVGAGPAGIAAAREARRLGLDVMLVDEHPIASALIGLDVPFMFGERLGPAVQNKARMLERVLNARPEIEELFEVGVDVRLGVYAWGAFVNGATSRSLPHSLLALADEERSWLVSFDRMIVAAGARDLALAFPGWDRPGVMGAQGFAAAIKLYQAFSGQRVVILGTGRLGLAIASEALMAGIEVAGIVDVEGTARPNRALDELRARGVSVHSNHVVQGTLGKMEIEGVRIAPLGSPDASFEITCDTIVSALDIVPTTELFDLLGCNIASRAELGGFVPLVDAEGRTSVPGVYAAGDCVGVTDAAMADPARAAASGVRAARAAAHDSGIAVDTAAPPPAEPLPDRSTPRRAWLQAHSSATGETIICRCEEVSLNDLLGVRPPPYLKWNPQKPSARDLRTLIADGPVNQDQVKRLTRAGMGACQGRRCREQVQLLLALQGNQPIDSIPMPTYRAPLRPLPLNVLAAHDENPEMRKHWVSWFGIPSQWLPHWEKVPDVIDPRDDRIGLKDIIE